MESDFANELSLVTQLVVKYGPGVGARGGVEEEVVHLSLQLATDSETQGVVESQDNNEPHCYHYSRRLGLDLAISKQAEIASLGFAGPAVALRIPGIPFPQGQDSGLHISLYNQPKVDGAEYTPPDMDKCKALAGQRFNLTLAGALKILNGNEQNDLKVGGCYYVSIGCGEQATSIANDIKSRVGLPPNVTQEFHLTLATIAPVWWNCHPKSAMALQATAEEKKDWQEKARIFRYGDGDAFSGFNDDLTTGWSTHAEKMADAGKANADILLKMKSGASDDETMRLQKQLIDIPATIGFCKTVGQREGILKITMPDVHAQLGLNDHFNPCCPVILAY